MWRTDVAIFGGGVAGLWLLDELVRGGQDAVLFEAGRLGSGQTITAQGIIHGGLKYSLAGQADESALRVSRMPRLWSRCLAGLAQPDLSTVTRRSAHCLLWHGRSLGSRLGFLGARLGLEVTPRRLPEAERPELLVDHPGPVAVMDEPVIEPASLLSHLADRHQQRILQIDVNRLTFQCDAPGRVRRIQVGHPFDKLPGSTRDVVPGSVVLTAGAGNAALRQALGLSTEAMQRRPLHMVMLRGASDRLPPLCGHQVDGARTRLTITSTVDAAGRTIWQLGGQLAEDGVGMDRPSLVAHAAVELAEVVPALDLEGLEASTYRVDRAEATTTGGRRPAGIRVLAEGNTFSCWPTKMALAPVLADDVMRRLTSPGVQVASTGDLEPLTQAGLTEWPRPRVAVPPWDVVTEWLPMRPARPSRQAA